MVGPQALHVFFSRCRCRCPAPGQPRERLQQQGDLIREFSLAKVSELHESSAELYCNSVQFCQGVWFAAMGFRNETQKRRMRTAPGTGLTEHPQHRVRQRAAAAPVLPLPAASAGSAPLLMFGKCEQSLVVKSKLPERPLHDSFL